MTLECRKSGLAPRWRELRIARAKRLLENGRLTIQEVAAEVGYSDLLFFRRLFRRHAGVSPSDYRKRFGAPAALNPSLAAE